MVALNENITDETELVPQTPLQDAVEGHAAIAGSSLTYRYDVEGQGQPREWQRIASVLRAFFLPSQRPEENSYRRLPMRQEPWSFTNPHID